MTYFLKRFCENAFLAAALLQFFAKEKTRGVFAAKAGARRGGRPRRRAAIRSGGSPLPAGILYWERNDTARRERASPQINKISKCF